METQGTYKRNSDIVATLMVLIGLIGIGVTSIEFVQASGFNACFELALAFFMCLTSFIFGIKIVSLD